MTGYVYCLDKVEGDKWGEVVATIEGDDNEGVEIQFEALYGSNDFALSYCEVPEIA